MASSLRRVSPRLANAAAGPGLPMVQAAAAAPRLSKRQPQRRAVSTSSLVEAAAAAVAPKTAVAAPKAAAAGGLVFKHGTLSKAAEERRAAQGATVIAGVDEAGRGPLAGPVVAAAVTMPVGTSITGVHDSKKLNKEQREHLYEQIMAHPDIDTAVGVKDNHVIDDINILQASMAAMEAAVAGLSRPPDHVFVDGPRVPAGLADVGEAVVKGDSKVHSIAAASVVAKVTRDRMMLELDAKYPVYNFKQHMGYPTKQHQLAVHKHGPSPVHRRTFAPLKHWFPLPSSEEDDQDQEGEQDGDKSSKRKAKGKGKGKGKGKTATKAAAATQAPSTKKRSTDPAPAAERHKRRRSDKREM